MSSTTSSRTIRLCEDLCQSRPDLNKQYRACPIYPNNLRNPLIYFAQYSSRKDIDGRKKSSALTRAFNWYTQERGPSVSSAYYPEEPRTRFHESEMRDFSEWLDRKFAEFHREKMVSRTNSPPNFSQREQPRSTREYRNEENYRPRVVCDNFRKEDLEFIMKPKQIHYNRSTLNPPKPSEPQSSEERPLNTVSMDAICRNPGCNAACNAPGPSEDQKRYVDAQCQNSTNKVGLQDAECQYERRKRKAEINDENNPFKKKIEELWVLPKSKFQIGASDDYVKECSCCTNHYTNNMMKQRPYKNKENNSEMQTSNHEVDLKDMCNGPFMIRFLQVQEERMRR